MVEVVDIKEEKIGNVLVLHMKGRLDAVSSPGAEKKVFEHINAGETKLVLDFTEVDYLSSAGMRMLLSATKKLKSLAGKLIICSVATNVMDVLKMSGFDHVLEFSKTPSDAAQKLQ
jgi:anti-anti-sigma factor